MVNIDFISKKYFKGRVEAKHLQEFKETTPEGNLYQVIFVKNRISIWAVV